MRGILVLIAIAYIVIAAPYAIGIPFGHAPDESAHLPYVKYLAQHHRLPVFKVGTGSYEYHQAPLYYAAAVPAYLAGAAISPGREYLAVRLFGILLGLGVIALTYMLARDFCPARPWLAVGAAGFVAFLPMHVALSTSVSNDVAAEIPFAAGLWQLLLALRDGWTRRRVLTVGALCGLAVLTKSSALVLLVAAWLALVLQVRQEGAWRCARRAAGVTAIALVVCGWWLARNWAVYGDPLASRAFMEAFVGRRPTPTALVGENLSAFNYVLWVIGWTFASFWGVFGTMNVFLPVWGVYVPLAGITALAVAGAVIEGREYVRWEPWRKRAGWVVLAVLVLVGASFVRFNLSFFQAQGRYLFLGLPVIAMLLVAGWGRVFPQSWRGGAYAVLWLAMMLLSVIALPAWILPQM